jgi:hypothetical protein
MGPTDWENFINNGILNGNPRDLESYRKAYSTDAARFGKVKSLIDAELVKFSDPEWDNKYKWSGNGTKDDYIKKLQNVSNSLAGNVYNDDVYKSLYEAGIADYLQQFLDNNYGQPATTTVTNPANSAATAVTSPLTPITPDENPTSEVVAQAEATPTSSAPVLVPQNPETPEA